MNKSHLRVEILEDRTMPATWGNPWPDPMHLTLSFAPDGTIVGSSASSLFSDLNHYGSAADWQRTILRAYQTWAIQTNLNIGLVQDQGQAFGSAGLPQGDTRFGDIRIAAVPMPANDEMAIGSPFDPLAGTWSGDVQVNNQINFGTGTGNTDLFTLLLHEAGHSFGLPDTRTDTSSVEYIYYEGARTGLSATDIAAIQALYGGPRAVDPHAGHSTLATAYPINLLTNSDGSLGILVNGALSTPSDTDVYSFQAPLSLGGLSINLQAAGLSLLNARITVYDAKGQAIATAQSTDPLNNNVAVNLAQYTPLGTYYVKVQSATQDVFGVGSYRLQVKSVPLVGQSTDTLENLVNDAGDLVNHTVNLNGSMLTATLLPPLFTQASSAFEYSYRSSINNSGEADYYRIQMLASTTAPAMQVIVWATDPGGLVPQATVLDAQGRPVASQVLVNENGTFVVQVANPTPGATYFIKVQAASTSSHSTGNYFLAVDSSNQIVQLSTVAQGTLSATHLQDFGSLTIPQSELFHFTLTASTGTTAKAGVRVTIYNSRGAVMLSLLAQNGLPAVSGTVYLPQGTYQVRIAGGTPDGAPLPPIQYLLLGTGDTDPQGIQSQDPTQGPSGGSAGSGSTGTGTTTGSGSSGSTGSSASGSTSTSADGSGYTYTSGGSGSLAPEDPYSDPFQST